MLQPLPNVFLGYFHYQQDDMKLEQVGITHLVNVNCSTEKSQEQSNIFLEKYSIFGQTLDVLVIKLENEIIEKVFHFSPSVLQNFQYMNFVTLGKPQKDKIL